MKPTENQVWPAKVFYDGACPVCSREMLVYRERNRAGRLEFVDIADPAFRAEDFGLDSARVQQLMHVQLADGTVRVGVDAFRVIWRATPGMGWLAALAGWPVVRPLLDLAYRAFAANRHRLAKRCPISR